MIRRHSTRLSQANGEEPEEPGDGAQHRTAASDYPEMGSVLSDRPDPGRQITVIGARTAADSYGSPDPRDEDFAGQPGDTGMRWAEPAQQQWVHEHLGPQEPAPPPPWDPDMMSPVMARLAQIEEARQLLGAHPLERSGALHHATTINGTQVDDAGDAPEHGTVPRAGDPDSYDDRSAEGEGDGKWNQALPWGSKEDENGAAVGMYPEGVSAGGGPGISVGPVTAALDPAGAAGLRRHVAEDHGFPLQGDYGDDVIPVMHEGLHMSGLANHDHGEDYEHDPGWEHRDTAGGYHEFTGLRREARVPWTGKERGTLHRWQEEPTATWGDFVPSSDFPALKPGEHVSHEDQGEGIGAVEGVSDRQLEEHLRDAHGWDSQQVTHGLYHRSLRDVHEALHGAGLAGHRHAGGPEQARQEGREQSLSNMFGPDISSNPGKDEPEGYGFAHPARGGYAGGDPMLNIIRSKEMPEPPHPDTWEQRDPARFKRMMSALNVHVRVDGKELHDHDDEGNSLDTSPDNSGDKEPGKNATENKSPQLDDTDSLDNPADAPPASPQDNSQPGAQEGPQDGSRDFGDPGQWPAAGADVSETGRAYTQGAGDGKVTRGGPAPFSPGDADSGGGGDQDDDDPNATGSDDEDTPFSKDGALAMFTAAASSPSFRFEFTAAWNDVVAKAKRIREGGHVRIVHASAGMIIGEVRGDHDTYESGIQRPVGKRQAIRHWACGCPWASFHQKTAGRSFSGRPCSHVMALQFEAQARGMFGRPFSSDAGAPSWSPPSVVVKSWPPYEGEPHAGRWREEWRAPVARSSAPRHTTARSGAARWSAAGAPVERSTLVLLRSGEDPGTVGALRLLAGMRATADQSSAPWGSQNVSQSPPQKPYGATSPPNRDQDPGSYGFLAGPDPENWGGIQEDSAYQMPIGNTASAAHQVLVPGAPHPVPGDLHWPSVRGWQAEDQGTFGYTDHASTAGPSTAMDPRDPEGIRMEEARRATSSGTPFPCHGTVPQPGGALAELRDEPEPALPSTTGDDEIESTAASDGTTGGGDAGTGQGQGAPLDTASLGEFGASAMGDLGRETWPQAQQPSPVGKEPGMGPMDDALSPDDPSIQAIGNQQWSGGGADSDEVAVEPGQPQGSVDDVVASFQRSAAASGYSGGSARADGDIAVAARRYLAKTADVLPAAEADELVREGAGSRARNLDLLRLEGTHYEGDDEELARKGISLDDYDDDVIFP